MTERAILVVSALYGLLGVAAGAFGAHALEGRLPPGDLAIFETAVRYQLLHAVALLAVAGLGGRGYAVATPAWSFTLGVLIFSGSLYLLVLTGARWLGAITPIGGIALLVGWAALAWSAVRGG